MSRMKKPYEFNLPGYKKGMINFIPVAEAGGSQKITIYFAVSPTAVQEQRSNSAQIDKTMSGWFISRTGPGLGTLTLSGFLLDTKDAPERLEFLKNYKAGAQDSLNSYLEYSNPYKQTIDVEGTEYFGFIQNLSISKSSVSSFAYSFNLNFVFINDRPSYSYTYSEGSSSSRTEGSASASKNMYSFNSIDGMTKTSVSPLTVVDNKDDNSNSKHKKISLSERSDNVKTTPKAMSSRTLGILMGDKGVD